MQEKIGNVILNCDYYGGSDLYSDGPIEDFLLKTVQETTEDDYDRVINESGEWPVFYHLSHLRENILNWYEFDKKKTALEIGAGCGALTGLLARECRKVDCIELSMKRSLINAYRNKEKDNIEVFVSNFQDFAANEQRKYDYITLIGVLEYSESYIQSPQPQIDFLKQMKGLLKKNGLVFVAIENKTGMKYWAGCCEDHLGKPYIGIENYPGTAGVRTFTDRELRQLFSAAGFTKSEFYYPYPDYKFPQAIYTDAYLPRPGTLSNSHTNFDQERFVTFDEQKAYDTVISNDMFPFFSNSYLVLIH